MKIFINHIDTYTYIFVILFVVEKKTVQQSKLYIFSAQFLWDYIDKFYWNIWKKILQFLMYVFMNRGVTLLFYSNIYKIFPLNIFCSVPAVFILMANARHIYLLLKLTYWIFSYYMKREYFAPLKNIYKGLTYV